MVRSHILHAVYGLLLCLAYQLTDKMAEGSNQSTINTAFLRAIGPTTLGDLLEGNTVGDVGGVNSSCLDVRDSFSSLLPCLENQCLSAEQVGRLYNIPLDSPLSELRLIEVAPAVLYAVTQKSSCISSNETDISSQHPSTSAVWGYSFLFVTLINLCSLTGVLVIPCMKSKSYKVILMFMVALAVGTLVGSGVLVLIPEAFNLTHVEAADEEGEGSSIVWTSTSVIGGIYLFFLIERIMRMVNIWRENSKEKKRQDELATRGTMTSSFTRQTPHNARLKMKDPATVHLEQSPSAAYLCSMAGAQDTASPEKGYHQCSEDSAAILVNGDEVAVKGTANGHSYHGHHNHHEGQVAPVAYMVIFGDGLHNFIDGLSIGAAFTESIMLGISVSVAVMCEELPHELGDFAILLNAGMRLRKALMYNFLSSLMCYLGLFLGILVGENTTAHTWIFGLAGGMFLYIALVDMMPEMNSAADSEEGKQLGIVKTFLLQNVGLLTGYVIMLFMVLYGDNIHFE